MVKVLYKREHLEAHENDWVVSLDEALAATKRALFHGTTRESRTGFFRKVVQRGNVFGRTGVVETQDVVWGYRKNRNLPSRFSAKGSERELVQGLVVIGRWLDTESFQLITVFPGSIISPPELADKKLWRDGAEALLDEAIHFWQKYAFTPEQMEAALSDGQSAEIEKALKSANTDLLMDLLLGAVKR